MIFMSYCQSPTELCTCVCWWWWLGCWVG